MAILSKLTVQIEGRTAGLTKSLKQAEGRTRRFGRSVGSAVKIAGRAFAGFGLLAVGALVAISAALTKSLLDTEKELRPAVERSRIMAESLQVLAEAAVRAGSEDGLEAVVDSSQELQLQLGEVAKTGNSRALPALIALGLQAEKLQMHGA